MDQMQTTRMAAGQVNTVPAAFGAATVAIAVSTLWWWTAARYLTGHPDPGGH